MTRRARIRSVATEFAFSFASKADTIVEARFTADACALCIASASLLTDGVRGMTTDDAEQLDARWIARLLGGDPPPGRVKCATLPLDTLRRAASESAT